jgi:hypothetical protein
MVAQVRGAESPLAKLNAMTGVLGAVIGIVGLFLTYMATASQVHWPPFARPAIQRPPISSRPPTLSPTPRLPGAAPTPPSSASTRWRSGPVSTYRQAVTAGRHLSIVLTHTMRSLTVSGRHRRMITRAQPYLVTRPAHGAKMISAICPFLPLWPKQIEA